MNDAQHEAYSAYLRHLADLLQLKDWEIELQREYPDDKSVWACVQVGRNYKHAFFRLAWPEFFDSKDADTRRLYLVHEVLHVHLDRPHQMMADLADMFPDNTATKFARDRHDVEIENAVHALACIIAPFMPLPPEVS